MRNITHQLSAGAVQPGDALAEEAIVQGRRTRAARDEIALLRWLGRSAHSAVALVRGGRLTMTNALFRELELRDGEWRWFVGPHGQVRYPSLRHLVCGEARELLRGEDPVRTAASSAATGRWSCGWNAFLPRPAARWWCSATTSPSRRAARRIGCATGRRACTRNACTPWAWSPPGWRTTSTIRST